MRRWHALFLFLLSGCGSLEIEILDYPRDNTKVIILELGHKAAAGDLLISTMQYQRKIVHGKKQQAEITLFFKAQQDYPDLKGQAIITVDNISYELTVADIYSYTETRDVGLVGVFGVSDSSKVLRGRIIIPQEVEQKIFMSEKIEYSLFFGNYPIKLRVMQHQLDKLKEFLNYIPG